MTVRHNLKGIYHKQWHYDKTFKMFRKYGINKFTKKTDLQPLEKIITNVDKYKMVFGHFTIDKWKCLGWPFVTIVRDPVERVISQYSVWKRGEKRIPGVERWGIKEFALDTSDQMSTMMGEDLSLFLFIGIQEMYEESIRRMGEILGIEFPADLGMYNKTRIKLKVSQEERDYVESVNQKDRKLYEEVLRRFECQTSK
jgi:hypothetical protein